MPGRRKRPLNIEPLTLTERELSEQMGVSAEMFPALTKRGILPQPITECLGSKQITFYYLDAVRDCLEKASGIRHSGSPSADVWIEKLRSRGQNRPS